MIKSRRSPLHREDLQNEMELDFMATPNVSLSTPYYPVLQTQDYRTLRASDEVMTNSFSVADLNFSWLTEAKQQLQEVYQEVMDTCTLDSEIESVPDSAYRDAFWLLKILDYYNVPMPDIGWLMDGGIDFEWRSKDSKGIATMSMYGDNQVVYGASLGGTRRVKGTCALSNLRSLTSFLTMLAILFYE